MNGMNWVYYQHMYQFSGHMQVFAYELFVRRRLAYNLVVRLR